MKKTVQILACLIILIIPVISIGEPINYGNRLSSMEYTRSANNIGQFNEIQIALNSSTKGNLVDGEQKIFFTGFAELNKNNKNRLIATKKINNTRTKPERKYQQKIFGGNTTIYHKNGSINNKKLYIYRIKIGDTLGKIAVKEGVSVKDLLSWNKQIRNKHLIFPGKKLKIYGTTLNQDNQTLIKSAQTNLKRKRVKRTERKTYIVQYGDTLGEIAKRYDTTIEKIMANNSIIYNKNIIWPGMKLKISTDNVKTYYRTYEDMSRSMSLQEKIAIFKKVGRETGVNWRILYGLCKKESYLGKDMVGDNGKSIGWFQIHRGFHPDVSHETCMDLERSSRYAANFLIKLGYFKNKFNALRRYNGSLKNPVTARRARKVLYYAKEV